MIYNTAFDAATIGYDQAYENSLHFSTRFQQYATQLARELTERHGLEGKDVLEIGCGKGDFLKILCELGGNRGVGFDLSYEGPEEIQVGSGRVRFVREFYSDSHASVPADLICCRHVLEHIPDPVEFLRRVRAIPQSGPDRPVLFLEVPNALFTLRDLGIWDVIYEHCSYFSPPALRRVVREAGYRPCPPFGAFGDQYLCIETGPSGPAAVETRDDVVELGELARRFGAHFDRKVATWNEKLDRWLDAGRRVAIWGAGSKGVTFLNTLRRGAAVTCAIDINPRKHGRFVPGTGQEVVAPEAVAAAGISTVLVMNPLYADEIRTTLIESGASPEVEVV